MIQFGIYLVILLSVERMSRLASWSCMSVCVQFISTESMVCLSCLYVLQYFRLVIWIHVSIFAGFDYSIRHLFYLVCYGMNESIA